MSVIWHDIECGAYGADIALWRALAREHPGPLLDVGAGTGRITLDLAREGRRVVALDRDADLLAELSARGAGLEVETVVADAREFSLAERFALIIVPMQTIQLLGGAGGRRMFLGRARGHLTETGVLAIAISEHLELYETDGLAGPLPDIRELGGIVYSSQPTAVRADEAGFVLERRRETIDGDGTRTVEQDVIRIDPLLAAELEREASEVGLNAAGRIEIPPTADHVGSVVVMFRG
ncbi:MAG TPA: methyltransferase domain-containing protein [Solirubrobacteraceae bacterium]|jgi:SAM-dependent methyltransferase